MILGWLFAFESVGRAQKNSFPFLQSILELYKLVIELTNLHLAPLGLEPARDKANLLVAIGYHGLNRDINAIFELVDQNLDFGAHPRLGPVLCAVDRDVAQVDFQIGILPAV